MARAPGTSNAVACAALLMAQFVGGRAARDALYLSHLPVTSLPAAVAGTSLLALVCAAGISRLFRHASPSRVFVFALWGMAVAFFLNGLLFTRAPRLAAVVTYLQISALGPVLGSTLWLIATERFDPRAARFSFARMISVGTLGGLAGGVLAERVGANWGMVAVFPMLALLNVAAAWFAAPLAASAPTAKRRPEPARSAPTLRALALAPFLRNLVLLVGLGAVAATLLDYTLKVHADAALDGDAALMRFFAWYYVATSLGVFLIQTGAGRLALERLGLAGTAATPSVAVVAGGLAAMVMPGPATAVLARGGEAVLRGSLFRSSYEIFFTPLGPADKRAVKSMIDVGADRIGEAAAAGLIALVLTAPTAWQHKLIVLLAIGCGAGGIWTTRRLTRGYVDALERSLREKEVELSAADVRDRTTRTVWQTAARPDLSDAAAAAAGPIERTVFDVDLLQILALRSGDLTRIARVLDPRTPLSPPLIPHVVALLDSPEAAKMAARALSAAAGDHAGELIDGLLDARRSISTRRHIARILAASPSKRGIDGLLAGLEDPRFGVRMQCAKALSDIREAHPELHIDEARIHDAVLGEVSRGRDVWEGRRALEEDETGEEPFVDRYLRERADQGLALVFTLLAVVLPAEPLRMAYRGLHTDEPALRATALEYLESVLPAEVRQALWPFVDDASAPTRAPRPRGEVVTRLVQAHPSILWNLQRQSAPRVPAKD